MKTNSIKKALPRLAKITIFLLIALILPANLWVQLYAQHKSQRENSEELFCQLRRRMETKEKKFEEDKKEFSERCIRAAEIAAYCIESRPEVTESPEAARALADKLDVAEIHCFTPEGVLYGGTHPEYYGLTVGTGEQMRYFLPMLKDPSMKLCQEITANTAEGRPMQYAAVWEADGSGIIQIGIEAKEILQDTEEKSLETVVSDTPLDMRGYLHAVDLNTKKITASTDPAMVGVDISSELENMETEEHSRGFHYQFQGKKYCVYTQRYGTAVLVRCYPSESPLRSTLISTMMVLAYLVLTAVAVVGGITWYMDKKLARNLVAIVDDLKKVEKGDFRNISVETDVTEFNELIFYMNEMLKSIRLGWNKLTRIVDKGRIPIGIFEHNWFFGKSFLNSRLLDMLGIEECGQDSLMAASEAEQRLEEAMGRPLDEGEQIYEYNRNGDNVYLKIEKQTDDQSVTYYVSDMSQWWKEINELREQSSHDSLTGLYNRRGFNNRMEELFGGTEDLGWGVIIMMDADGLKRINNMYGHSVGDEYLRRIGAIIKDTAQPGSVCARLGGDEFIVFLYGYDSRERVDAVCGALKAKRGEEFMENGTAELVEFSVGCAVYPVDGKNYHVLMHKADENMYLEKRERKALYMGGGIKMKYAEKPHLKQAGRGEASVK